MAVRSWILIGRRMRAKFTQLLKTLDFSGPEPELRNGKPQAILSEHPGPLRCASNLDSICRCWLLVELRTYHTAIAVSQKVHQLQSFVACSAFGLTASDHCVAAQVFPGASGIF